MPRQPLISDAFPQWAAQWHTTRNPTPTPESITAGCQQTVWWRAEDCGHEWDCTVYQRTRSKTACWVCSGKRILPGFNDLPALAPRWAPQWHPTKNDKHPTEVGPLSHVVAWWRAEDCGHEWDAAIWQRTKSDTVCWVCSGKRILPGFNDLPTLAPRWAPQWHPTKNNKQPTEVGPLSEFKVWWQAEGCGHEWDAKVVDRTRSDIRCYVCAGRRIVAGFNDLATLHPKVAAEWHPWLNGHASPIGHAPKIATYRWWTGKKCGHTWYARVAHRANGAGCPFCDGKQVLIGFNDIATTHAKTAATWHPWLNPHLTPTSVIAGSDKMAWWLCAKDHAYWAKVDSRVRLDSGCHYCSGHRVLIGFNDLRTTHAELCEEWHPTKNTRLPTSLSAGSGVEVWWQCRNCSHEWPAPVARRTTVLPGRARPTGCPECKWSTWGTSETEDDLFAAMREHIPDLSASHALARSPEHAAKRKTWRVDMFSAALNLVIEYDGELWHLPSIFPGGEEAGMAVLRRDHLKTDDLLAQGYRVLRVRSGKLPKITDNDLLVHAQWSGALAAEALVDHLARLGWLLPDTAEVSA